MALHETDALGPVTAAPGTYALLLLLPAARRLQIGRLGAFAFPPGYYLYLGSALGPGGLAARLGRHLRTARAAHWHVDHLRGAAAVVELWWAAGPRRGEHAWAAAAAGLPGRPFRPRASGPAIAAARPISTTTRRGLRTTPSGA